MVKIIHKKSKGSIKKVKGKSKASGLPPSLHCVNLNAAGIDIGSESHFVAVPEGTCGELVREFKSFTVDLHALANWLVECGVDTVAMESTGVYWIPLFDILETRGFDVRLVDARHVKNVSGRKTDVLDCQWLQQLHTYGLLSGAFRPDEEILTLRTYMRQRTMLIQASSSHILHMQKALSQMNIQLHNVISDITGETGMKIIRDIVAGQRNPKLLAQHRSYRCKNSLEMIEKSLEGNYRQEYVFALKQALELYDVYHEKIIACDLEMERQLLQFESHPENGDHTVTKKPKSHTKNAPSFAVSEHLKRITGVDLTAVPGVEELTALTIISEIGLDLGKFRNSKAFASWLGLCPGNKVSGGKRLSSKSKRSANKAATALRIAAGSMHHSKSAMGAFYRRMRARLGAPKAITATAHKIATIIYNMLTKGQEYVEAGQDYYEDQYRQRVIKSLQNKARTLGFTLVENNLRTVDQVAVP